MHLTETPQRVILEAFLKQVTNDRLRGCKSPAKPSLPTSLGKKRPVTFDTGRLLLC
jgi:hypothetical protein